MPRRVGVADQSIVPSDQSADIAAGGRHVALGVAIAGIAGNPSHQPADIEGGSIHVPGGKAPADVAGDPSRQPADITAGARHRPGRGATDDVAGDPTHLPADIAAATGHSTRCGVVSQVAGDPARHSADVAVGTAVGGHRLRGVAVENVAGGVSCQIPDIAAAGHASARQRHVLQHRAAGTHHVTEQAHIVRKRPIDREVPDGVAEAVEVAVEGGGHLAHRIEASTGVPATSRAGIDVAAQRIVGSQVAVHPLQVGGGDATLCAEAGDDGVVDRGAVRTQLSGEIITGGKTHRCQDDVLARVARSDGGLAV